MYIQLYGEMPHHIICKFNFDYVRRCHAANLLYIRTYTIHRTADKNYTFASLDLRANRACVWRHLALLHTCKRLSDVINLIRKSPTRDYQATLWWRQMLRTLNISALSERKLILVKSLLRFGPIQTLTYNQSCFNVFVIKGKQVVNSWAARILKHTCQVLVARTLCVTTLNAYVCVCVDKIIWRMQSVWNWNGQYIKSLKVLK